jgi:hypothetical protein
MGSRIKGARLQAQGNFFLVPGASRLKPKLTRELLGLDLVELDEALPVGGHVGVDEDGVHGALGFAEAAVDALVGVNKHLVFTLINAIHGANGHAGLVLDANTGFGNYVGHLR